MDAVGLAVPDWQHHPEQAGFSWPTSMRRGNTVRELAGRANAVVQTEIVQPDAASEGRRSASSRIEGRSAHGVQRATTTSVLPNWLGQTSGGAGFTTGSDSEGFTPPWTAMRSSMSSRAAWALPMEATW